METLEQSEEIQCSMQEVGLVREFGEVWIRGTKEALGRAVGGSITGLVTVTKLQFLGDLF